MGTVERYLITWLLYGNEQAADMVGYTADPAEWENYKVVIIPNGHLGKDLVYPDMSHPEMEGKFVSTDIVYTAFFFTSRAEELLTTQRDKHGRFAASCSILGQGNRLQIPLLDEYSRFLIKALKCACEEDGVKCPVRLPKAGYEHICLTHDIDVLERYRHPRGAIGGLLRGQWRQVKASWQDIQKDPAYTFPTLMEADHMVLRRFVADTEEDECANNMPKVDIIYFAKHTRGRGYDYPQYNRHGRHYLRLLDALKRSNAQVGMHSSYYGFHGHSTHALHRSHYLRCDIDNMQRLAEGGVTDDYSMQFADHCGFRLQTCRPVRWINPKTMQLTTLTLHPLTIMDSTLFNPDYMNLSEDEAYFYCQRLMDKIRQNHGELVLLWHNIDPSDSPYHKSLYPKLLGLIR